MGKALCEASAAARAVFEEADRGPRVRALAAVLRGARGGAEAHRQHAARDPDPLDRRARGPAAPVRPRSSRARPSPRGTRSASTRPTSPPGALAFADAVALVRARGQFMQEAVPRRRRGDGGDRRPRPGGRRSRLPRGGAGRDRRARQLQLAGADGHRRGCRRRRAGVAGLPGARGEARDRARGLGAVPLRRSCLRRGTGCARSSSARLSRGRRCRS